MYNETPDFLDQETGQSATAEIMMNMGAQPQWTEGVPITAQHRYAARRD